MGSVSRALIIIIITIMQSRKSLFVIIIVVVNMILLFIIVVAYFVEKQTRKSYRIVPTADEAIGGTRARCIISLTIWYITLRVCI